MQRRHFLQQGFAAGAASLVSSSLLALGTNKAKTRFPAEKTFNLDYAFHEGTFANSAGKDFIEQIKFGYSMGFRAIEDNNMMKRTPEQQSRIGETLAALGMRMGVFVIEAGDNWKTSLTTGKAEFKERFVAVCGKAVEVAKRCNAKWMTVVPGYYERQLPIGLQTSNVIDALRAGAAVLEPHNLVMVLEPLSDTPDLFLRHSDQTHMICKAVNSPSCKILYDIYHMQRNEGNIISNIDKTWDEIAYIQIGDNPGRKEPGTGEINYRNIFKHLYGKGYKGVMGMEHGNARPGKEGEQALIKAYRESDSFLM